MKAFWVMLVLTAAVILTTACTPLEASWAVESQTPAAAVTQPAEAGQASSPVPGLYNQELAAAGFKKAGCVACHVIPGVPGATGTVGPDLTEIGVTAGERLASGEYSGAAKSVEDYLNESIHNPDAFVSPDCGGKPCQKGLMPGTLADSLSDEELGSMIAYLASLPAGAQAAPAVTPPPAESQPVSQPSTTETLTDEEFTWAKQTYFERCAGCHGTLRKGATGPALTPDKTVEKGTVGLAAIIFNGTTRGMPDWGKQGFFTQAQTETMAKYLQVEPPTPPEMSLEQMKKTWKVMVPPSERPTKPETTRDWENYFIVTLRDAGQVAVIDGDTHEVVALVDSGYAVHITRMSATGRYAYVIGRDGKLALIDLWMETPDQGGRGTAVLRCPLG